MLQLLHHGPCFLPPVDSSKLVGSNTEYSILLPLTGLQPYCLQCCDQYLLLSIITTNYYSYYPLSIIIIITTPPVVFLRHLPGSKLTGLNLPPPPTFLSFSPPLSLWHSDLIHIRKRHCRQTRHRSIEAQPPCPSACCPSTRATGRTVLEQSRDIQVDSPRSFIALPLWMENCLITCTSDGLPCFNLHLTEVCSIFTMFGHPSRLLYADVSFLNSQGSNLFPPSFVSSICYRPAVNSAHVVARPVERSCLYHRLVSCLFVSRHRQNDPHLGLLDRPTGIAMSKPC